MRGFPQSSCTNGATINGDGHQWGVYSESVRTEGTLWDLVFQIQGFKQNYINIAKKSVMVGIEIPIGEL